MKILHVVPTYIPAYRYGGPIKAVHELCRALVKKGIDVTVYTTDRDHEKRLNITLGSMHEIEGVKVFYYPVRFMRSYYYSRSLWNALKNNILKFDIVHIHSIYLHSTFSASYWCRKYKIPYIINLFGVLNPTSIRLKSYLKKMIYIKLIENRNITNAKFLQAASNYERDMVLSMGYKTPIKVIPRGLEPTEYTVNYKKNCLAEEYPQLKNKKIILFLGRIHPKKGLELVVEAFKKIVNNRKDVYLIIAGSGEERYTKKIKTLFKKSGMIDHSIFTGMLLGKEKLKAFYSSDVFILPSQSENFGIAVLEAMMCKLPVVITDRVGLYPDVEAYNAGIVTGCDADQIRDATLKLLDNNELKQKMGERAKKLVEDKFTADKIADKMITIYKEILKK